MDIGLSGISSDPISRENRSHSEIWDKELLLVSPKWYGIVSSSGKGKTSLVHFIYGLRHDHTGHVMLGGQEVGSMEDAVLSKTRSEVLSIVFQDLRLFPNLTVGENLGLKSTDTELAGEYLARLGIPGFGPRLAGRLSQGEKQRVAIARALLQPFQWLLLDEPFSHLDPANRALAVELIGQVCRQNNAGMVYTSLLKDDCFPGTEWLNL